MDVVPAILLSGKGWEEDESAEEDAGDDDNEEEEVWENREYGRDDKEAEDEWETMAVIYEYRSKLRRAVEVLVGRNAPIARKGHIR